MFQKIIVLGIDGLEFNLVKKWGLENLKQKNYCKLDLSDYSVIVTPPIWGSMITGQVDKEVMRIWEKSSRIVGFKGEIKQNLVFKLFFKIIYSPYLPLIRKLSTKVITNINSSNPFDITANYVNDKKLINVFQFFNNSWTNGIPGYGKNVSDSIKRDLLNGVISGDKKPFKDYTLKNYEKDKSDLLSIFEKNDIDLIFWYTQLLDNFGHMNISNEVYLLNYYLEINKFVGKIKSICPNSYIYIISDHGMERAKEDWGVHSNHAFFSSNTGELINKPVELYKLILKYSNKK